MSSLACWMMFLCDSVSNAISLSLYRGKEIVIYSAGPSKFLQGRASGLNGRGNSVVSPGDVSMVGRVFCEWDAGQNGICDGVCGMY